MSSAKSHPGKEAFHKSSGFRKFFECIDHTAVHEPKITNILW